METNIVVSMSIQTIYGKKNVCVNCNAEPILTEPDFESDRRIIRITSRSVGTTVFFPQKQVPEKLGYFCSRRKYLEKSRAKRVIKKDER